MKLENYKSAIDEYNKFININPNNSVVFFNRGIARLLLTKKDSGCIDLSKDYDAIQEYCK